MDERDAPSRAEIEAILWSTQNLEQPDRRDMIIRYLKDRQASDQQIDLILNDLNSYQNWNYDPPQVVTPEEAPVEEPVEEDNA